MLQTRTETIPWKDYGDLVTHHRENGWQLQGSERLPDGRITFTMTREDGRDPEPQAPDAT